jgi:hypothetical protein
MAAQILQRWRAPIGEYPLWMARTDLEAYYFAGSLPGAILGTAADARKKEADADAIVLREITRESVSDETFGAQERLARAIDALDATGAKLAVPKIASAFPEIKPFIESQYPAARSAADVDGSVAKRVLRRALVQTVLGAGDVSKWEDALGPR